MRKCIIAAVILAAIAGQGFGTGYNQAVIIQAFGPESEGPDKTISALDFGRNRR